MALIKCPECGKDVSDTAKMCPHCGYKIKISKSILLLLDDTMNFVISEILNIVLIIVGTFMFNKGKKEMLFWVQAKLELGVEDAMYCIKNISKYTLMKNTGIVLICVGIIVAISFVIYKFSSKNEESDKA